VTGYGIKRQGSLPVRDRNLILCHYVHNGFDIHKDAYPKRTGDVFSVVKWSEYEADQLPPTHASPPCSHCVLLTQKEILLLP
jgi:hypothetical protein